MDKIFKKITINIEFSYFKHEPKKINLFFASSAFRNFTLSLILKENVNYKEFKILNILYLNQSFSVILEVQLYTTIILKFSSYINLYNFLLYIQNNNHNSSNISADYSIYLINSIYYLILQNYTEFNIKLSDFNTIKYSPLIHSKIVEIGKKL